MRKAPHWIKTTVEEFRKPEHKARLESYINMNQKLIAAKARLAADMA